ncbi:hypothetical protein N180_18800 [Pedobacter antarcticus 4BY]|uniref:Uncharacterized protein n=2 Tax=Pedobacter antarcticus TaxID=34086 RepID=A0A081PDH6_9SPHI|nr:hypothetical protein [Pedobacter antarcticus]KEQ28749.1 hypothetical protein N180_18800 [Pedobacter antarcticus 4BY]SFF43520.1 hypothetical protein SAMN03003324_03852 [Pedobacter antarcticus]
MEKKFSFIDLYLRHPISVDTFLVCCLLLINFLCPVIFTLKYRVDEQLSVLSSLIGTCVSLAGFILAALTIIVAFKSNIAYKPLREADNPMQLLFSTDNYAKIIKVFKDAIIELSVVFIGLYIVWIMLGNLSPSIVLYSNIYSALLIFSTVFRTLFVLFLVLSLDKSKENIEE